LTNNILVLLLRSNLLKKSILFDSFSLSTGCNDNSEAAYFWATPYSTIKMELRLPFIPYQLLSLVFTC